MGKKKKKLLKQSKKEKEEKLLKEEKISKGSKPLKEEKAAKGSKLLKEEKPKKKKAAKAEKRERPAPETKKRQEEEILPSKRPEIWQPEEILPAKQPEREILPGKQPEAEEGIAFSSREGAELFRALGDENRIRILLLLMDGEQCVVSLLKSMSIVQSTLSHHLKILVTAGLITCRRQGKWSYYAVNGSALKKIRLYISEMEQKLWEK